MNLFQERFKLLREESGKTQAKVAKELGLTPQALSYYSKGREPSYDTLIKIADFFYVSTDYLLGRTEFRTVEEAMTMSNISDYQFAGISTEFSMMAYRKIKACFEKAQHFYIDKMQKGDNGCGNLFFQLNEKVESDIDLFDNMLSILLCSKVAADRNDVFKVFVSGTSQEDDKRKLNRRIMEELVEIDRELSAKEQYSKKVDTTE